jgi:hypothetical protein
LFGSVSFIAILLWCSRWTVWRSAQPFGELSQVGAHAPVQRLHTPLLGRRQLIGNLKGLEVSERAADATQFSF